MIQKQLFTIVLCAFAPVLWAQTWTSVNTGLSSDLTSVHFIDASNGYAVDADGALHHTTNGGQSWATISHTLAASVSVNGLYAWPGSNGDIILLSGNDNTISGTNAELIKSDDGGTTWETQDIGHTQGFENFITCIDANNCHLVGGQTNAGGMIATTTSGGPLWIKSNMADVAFFSHACFPTPTTGYAVGLQGFSFNKGIVYKTTDGHTWNNVAEPGNNSLTTIHCFDENTCVAGDGGGNVWQTSDGGTTWTAATVSGATWINGIGFKDNSTGYMTFQGGIIKTTDGGNTWSVDNSFPGGSDLNGLQVLGNHGVAYAIGDGGSMYKATFTANSVDNAQLLDAPKVWPIPATNALTIAADYPIDRIELLSITGQAVKVMQPNSGTATMQLENLQAGMYLAVVTAAGMQTQHRIVVQ